jgi:hypothetical protein
MHRFAVGAAAALIILSCHVAQAGRRSGDDPQTTRRPDPPAVLDTTKCQPRPSSGDAVPATRENQRRAYSGSDAVDCTPSGQLSPTGGVTPRRSNSGP